MPPTTACSTHRPTQLERMRGQAAQLRPAVAVPRGRRHGDGAGRHARYDVTAARARACLRPRAAAGRSRLTPPRCSPASTGSSAGCRDRRDRRAVECAGRDRAARRAGRAGEARARRAGSRRPRRPESPRAEETASAAAVAVRRARAEPDRRSRRRSRRPTLAGGVGRPRVRLRRLWDAVLDAVKHTQPDRARADAVVADRVARGQHADAAFKTPTLATRFANDVARLRDAGAEGGRRRRPAGDGDRRRCAGAEAGDVGRPSRRLCAVARPRDDRGRDRRTPTTSTGSTDADPEADAALALLKKASAPRSSARSTAADVVRRVVADGRVGPSP